MASQKIGSWAFVIGFFLALILGIALTVVPFLGIAVESGIVNVAALILVILGLVVGFLNIHDKHVTDFLIAVIAVSAVGGITSITVQGLDVGILSVIGALIANIVGLIVALVAPAGLIVGLKQILALAKEQVV